MNKAGTLIHFQVLSVLGFQSDREAYLSPSGIWTFGRLCASSTWSSWTTSLMKSKYAVSE